MGNIADESRDQSGFTLFEQEEQVMRRADVMIGELASVTGSLREFAEAYRQGYREQKHMVRISDRLQGDLQEANRRLSEQARELQILNAALETENRLREQLTAELRQIATSDGLTGLFTRRHLLELAEVEEKRWRRHGQPLSLIIVDVDFFKKINDSHGHLAGDEVLRVFAEICRTTFRATDIVGRFGGEEFLAVLPTTQAADACRIAERLRGRTEQESIKFADREIRFTISIGVTEMRQSDQSLEQTISRADQALYKAKNAGRNRTESNDN